MGKYQSHMNPFLYKLAIYVIVIFGLFSAYPYIFNVILPLPPLSVLSIILLTLLILFSVAKGTKLRILPTTVNKIFCIQVVCWILFIMLHLDINYIERIVYMLVIYTMLTCLYNCNGGIYDFFEKYDKWIVIMSIGGVIVFFLVLLIDFQPLLLYENKDERTGYFYLITATNTLKGNIIRYSGYFDEPGAMAYWGIWTLIFNRLFFQNSKVEKVLMVCLTFTFSLAYYIQIFFYILFFKLRNIKQGILAIITVLILGFGIYYAAQSVPILYYYTFHRIETDETTGQLKGDNRSSLSENAKEQFLKSPIIGVGREISSEDLKISDNPYETLAYDGIVGTIITYLPFLYLWFIGNRKFKLCIIILMIGFLQRPFHHYIIYYFMAYAFLILSLYKPNENLNFRYKNQRSPLRVYS